MFYKNLLVYINANVDKENDKVMLNQINNYKYPQDEFIKEIKKRQTLLDNNDIEVYCILGYEADIQSFKLEIKKRTNQFFENYKINNDYKRPKIEIDNKIIEEEFYNLYIQELIQEKVKFPLMLEMKKSDGMTCLVLYTTDNPKQNKESEINSIIDLFLRNEKPFFMGKQVMIQSFLLQDIKDRKILAVLPDIDGEGWYALLEGGIKLYLNDEMPYQREKISSNDVGIFTNLEINSITNNSIYAYKKLFVPYELFEEWNDVLLYALAILPIQYEKTKLMLLYEDFLNFIEENICDMIETESAILSKDEFIQVLLVKINNIRKYLEAKEEVGISKNFLILLKNKYVYLPVIYKIIQRHYPEAILKRSKSSVFSVEKWKVLLDEIQNTKDNYSKGISLEEAANYFISCIDGIKVTGKRVRLINEEIDLVCCNVSESLELWNLGAVILVECKNWKEKVDTKVIRNLSYLMDKKGISSMILFTKNNITSGARIEVKKQAAHNKLIIVLDLEELNKLNDGKTKPIDILTSKAGILIENINDEMEILM